MSNITVRHASKEDMPSIVPLMLELGYPIECENFVIRFSRFVQNPGYGVAVCLLNEIVVGFVAWSKSDLFVLDSVRFHIEGICVSSQYKHKGFGTKLLKFVEEIAQSSRPAIIDLTSGVRRGSYGVHEFYHRLGYKNEGQMAKLYLRKEL